MNLSNFSIDGFHGIWAILLVLIVALVVWHLVRR